MYQESRNLFVLLAGITIAHASLASNTYPAHRGNSPWSFDEFKEPSSTYRVNDTDGNNDTYLFRSGGPITLEIPIKRYVGPTDANGYLLNVEELVSKGVIKSTFSLRLPAYDVDENVFPSFDCDGDGIDEIFNSEVDDVYFNDEFVGALRGSNGVWQAQTFELPISELKFPSEPGETAVNTVDVQVDVANETVPLSGGGVGCEVWATEIDWASIDYSASAPVVLVHGIRSDGTAFANFQVALNENYLVNDASIIMTDLDKPDPAPVACEDIPYNNSIQHNVTQLKTEMERIASKYGSEEINIVAHSKGGLDSRVFLSTTIDSPMMINLGEMGGATIQAPLRANSLITLNSPHKGSILADYGVQARQLTYPQALSGGINTIAAKSLNGSYYCDLTTAIATSAMNNSSLPNGVQTASVATDADINNDGKISGNEGDGFQGGSFIANRLYNLVGGVSAVEIIVEEGLIFDDVIIMETASPEFLENDAVVTIDSAAKYSKIEIDNKHHMNVHDQDVAEKISDDALVGKIVNWGAK